MARLILLATTAIVWPIAAAADPVTFLVGAAASAAGTVVPALVGGTLASVAWAGVLGQAVVAGALAAISGGRRPEAPQAQDITLNRIQAVTNGLILYGERMLGGSIVARSTTAGAGKANGKYHSVIPVACHEIDSFQQIYLGEDLVWTKAQYDIDAAAATLPAEHWGQIATDFRHKVALKVYTGADLQTAESLYSDAAEEWDATSRLRGIAYVYFAADFDQNIFPRGVEQIRAVVRGKKVYDPRTDTTEYSENPFLHFRDYVLTPELRGGVGWSIDDIDDAEIIAAANVADDFVSVGGGSQRRYKFNGVLDTGLTPTENLNRLASAWGGWWAVDQGKIRAGGHAYPIPTVEITEDDMSGAMTVSAKRPFEDQFNMVKAVYADPSQQYTPTDLPVLESATYKAQDNAEDLIRDLGELPGETSHPRGQRLMKLALLKGRRQKSVTVRCTLAVDTVKLGDTVMVTVDRRGWAQKTFEVVGKSTSVAPGDVAVTLSLLETGPDIFDWSTSEEVAKPAGGVSNLLSPRAKPVVSAPIVEEEIYQTRGGGGVKVRALLTATTDNPYVTEWQFSWRPVASSRDTVRGIRRDATDMVVDLEPGAYVFGARARTRRGRWSDWAYTEPAEVTGLSTQPAAPSGFAVSLAGETINLRWGEAPEIDVRLGGKYQVKHSQSLAGDWQEGAYLHKAVPGSATGVTLPAITGLYMLRAVNAIGLTSDVVSIAVEAFNPFATTALGEPAEAVTFAGTKTNVSVSGSTLVLDVGETSGEYEFANSSVRTALDRLLITAKPQLQFFDRDTLFDSDEMFDSSAFFDGGTAADGDVEFYYRYKVDAADPWSGWIAFDKTSIEARQLQYKVGMYVNSDAYGLTLSELAVSVEKVD